MPHDYASLLAKAQGIIQGHNESGGSPIDYEKFVQGLKDLGGTDVAALRQISWEDLQGIGVPKLRARQMADIFREEDEGDTPQLGFTADTAASATDRDLVHAYDPRRATGPVATELRTRSGNRPFIVFDESGGVHRKATLELLVELINGDPVREHYKVGDTPHSVYRVGEKPTELLDEHPLFPGTSLRRNGTDALDLNWGSLKLQVRQLLRFAVLGGELRVGDNDSQHDLFSRVAGEGENAVASLRTRYPRAWIAFTEAVAADSLPRLKMAASAARQGRSDPVASELGVTEVHEFRYRCLRNRCYRSIVK